LRNYTQTNFLPLGEHPTLGEVPKLMLSQVIRESRFGEPKNAFKIEKIPVPELAPNDVLIFIMAAGANYNGVWAASGIPINLIDYRRKQGDIDDFHIAGSDASGVVWEVGSEVSNVKVGDEVVIHCGFWDSDDPHIISGKDPAYAHSQKIWGYEVNYGSFAQYARVQAHQCLPKPDHLTWEEASSYMLTGATAYRMLLGWEGNRIQQGNPVLIWGGSGGLGSVAIQICKAVGARPVAVISDNVTKSYCIELGAVGTINRKDFNHWGILPHWKDKALYASWLKEVRRFGRAFWDVLGEKCNPVIIIEHPGENTIPTSVFLVDNGGMVVTCAGTTGYNASLDLRYLWMRQKRLQGSHFANDVDCNGFNQMILNKKLNPVLGKTFSFEETGICHQLIHENDKPPGKMAILVNATQTGLKTFGF
jgi:crotonyl-CoA carboxylase/reductase